jgi:hypothetical protein
MFDGLFTGPRRISLCMKPETNNHHARLMRKAINMITEIVNDLIDY